MKPSHHVKHDHTPQYRVLKKSHIVKHNNKWQYRVLKKEEKQHLTK